MAERADDRMPRFALLAIVALCVAAGLLWLVRPGSPAAPDGSLPPGREQTSSASRSAASSESPTRRSAVADSDPSINTQPHGVDERPLELTFVDPAGTPIARLPFHALQLGEPLRGHLQRMRPAERRVFNDCMAPSVVELGRRLVTDDAGKADVPFPGQALAVAAWHNRLAGLQVLTPSRADQDVDVKVELRPAQIVDVRITASTPDSALPIAIDWLHGDDLLATHSLGFTRSGTLTFPWLGVLRAAITQRAPDHVRFRIDVPGAPFAGDLHPARQSRFFVQLQAPDLAAARTFSVVDAAGAPRPTFRGRCDVRDTAGHLWTYPILEGRCEIESLAASALNYLLRDGKGRIVGADALPPPGAPDVLVTNRQTVIRARLENPSGSPLDDGSVVTIQPAGGDAATTRLGPDGKLCHSLGASEGTALRFDVSTPATPLVARATLPAAQAGMCDLGTIRLRAPEASLKVLVTDPTGRPLPDAELTARQHNRDLETRSAEDGNFLVFAAALEAPVFLRATAPSHTTTLAETLGEPRLTLIVEPAIQHEIVLDLPDRISPHSLAALLITDLGEHAPDDVTTADGSWRGNWARAPQHATRLRILARCPTRIVQESPLELSGSTTRLEPTLRGWRQAEVSITRYRHWGVYVAPLDRAARLRCTEVIPGDPLLVREAEDLLFFGPELMGVLCATRNAGSQIQLEFAASPHAVPAEGSPSGLRAQVTCTLPLLRDDVVVETTHWPGPGVQPIRESTRLGALLRRSQESDRLHFPFAYDAVLVNGEGKTRPRVRIEPPFGSRVAVPAGASSGR